MTSGHVFIATSLDGFVARLDHQLDWLTKQDTGGEEHGYEAFMASVDGLVMGRGSYTTVLAFEGWPYEKPVVVMSKSLTQADVPARLAGRVRIVASEPAELMDELDRQGWRRVYVDGGRVVQSFLGAGLIEDLTLTLVPILIGTGQRLFGELDADIDLELLEATPFESGLVRTRYRVRAPTPGPAGPRTRGLQRPARGR